MDFLNAMQIWGIVLFFFGAGLLSLCSKWEREEEEWLKDPRNRYRQERRKNDVVMPKTVRGILMTLFGSLISLTGITLFFLNISMPG